MTPDDDLSDESAIRTPSDEHPDRDDHPDDVVDATDELFDDERIDAVRRLLKSYADGPDQPSDLKQRLQRGDATLVRAFGHPISVNEVHATALGLIGVIAGALILVGGYEAALSLSVVLLGYAVLGRPALQSLDHDHPAYKTIGHKTIKHEPWYFVGSYVLSLALTLAVGVAFGLEVDVSMIGETLDAVL